MGIEKRSEKLEAGASGTSPEWAIPVEVRVHCKAVGRHQALLDGEEPPAYSPEEVAAMRRWDLETVAGGGVEARLRESVGRQTEEGLSLLDVWEEDARRRLEAAEGLPPERWAEVWGAEDEEEEAAA